MKAWVCAAALLAAGCGPVPAAEYGAELFKDATLSESQYNTFSCATCHATTATPPQDTLYAGLSLHNVAARPRAVEAGGKALPFTWNERRRLLEVSLPPLAEAAMAVKIAL